MFVKSFHLGDEVLEALETSLSPERMSTYVKAAGGDREKALRLYTWNTAVSAAFYEPLQGLEITLRNAMHRQLRITYGSDWYDNPACGLDVGALDRIDKAKKTLQKQGYVTDPPHLVAALSFGFWVSLLGKGGRGPVPNRSKRNYDMTLWRTALHKAFPQSHRSRVNTHKPLDYLRTFRNRIAHHEPIFNRDLGADFHSILEVSSWLCPHTAAWIKHHSRVAELLVYERNEGKVLL
ncbi:MAG: Abi family protein [Candidatus Thiosymbion ectosymbiont of Robbea hypermnestra]|nr:Abi family protein [Candidatus Thiosymbion ectosymbiont of Robbea hypermnestra]